MLHSIGYYKCFIFETSVSYDLVDAVEIQTAADLQVEREREREGGRQRERETPNLGRFVQ